MCEWETPAIDRARARICAFVVAEALERQGVLGFGWELSSAGPTTYRELRQAFLVSALTKQPLPLNPQLVNNLSGVAPSTPSAHMDAAHAALFWHDTNHVRLGLDFTPDGEERLARWQLMQLQRAGFRPWSLEYRVMEADTAGQIECGRRLGRYPRDPTRFSTTVIRCGLAAAVDEESAA